MDEELDSVFNYRGDDDLDKQLEAAERNAEDRARNDLDNNNFDELANDSEQDTKRPGDIDPDEEEIDDAQKRTKGEELAHNLAEGLHKETLSLSKGPFNWLMEKTIILFTFIGDAFRALVFGYSRPFDWQNMMQREHEKETLKKAQEGSQKSQEQDGKNNPEQAADGQSQSPDGLQKNTKDVQNIQEKLEEERNNKMAKSVGQANVFMKSVGLASMYNTENRTLNIFVENDKCTVNINGLDDKLLVAELEGYGSILETIGRDLTTNIQNALDEKGNQPDGFFNENALKGLLCTATIIGNQLDLDSNNPFNDTLHTTLASFDAITGKPISIVADRVFDNSGAIPKARIELSCMYDGKVFAKMPLAALSNEELMNKGAFEGIKNALSDTLSAQQRDAVFEITMPFETVPEPDLAVNTEEKFMDALLTQCEGKGNNDISISTIHKEMAGSNVSCVGQITDVSVKQTKKGKDMCTFTLKSTDGEMKCVCPPNQYAELKNMIHDPSEHVRVTAEVSLNTYKGQESLELLPSTIENAELSQENAGLSSLTSDMPLGPEQVTDGYTIVDGISDSSNTEHEETREEIENRIMNGDYSEADTTDYDAMAEAIKQQQEEMGEAGEELC